MPSCRARLTVDDRRVEWLCGLSESRHAWMAEEIQSSAAVAGDGFCSLDVELGPLAVELGLSDVVAIGELARVGQPLAENWRDEGRHKKPSDQLLSTA